MSQINTSRLIISMALAFALTGCGDKNDKSTFDADSGHPSGWVVASTGGLHPSAYKANNSACVDCHGSAQNPQSSGGISGISCFSVSYNGIACHPNGLSGHSAVWGAPGSHGSAAKAAPDASHGFASCTPCHGANYGGGTGTSCMACHTTAPHPATPWRGTTSTKTTHTTTDQGNASECSRCHAGNARLTTPVAVLANAGCFNSTLCHGSVHSFPNQGSAHLGAANGTGCLACHAQGDAASAYPVAAGTAPNCRSCHLNANPGTSPQCSDCHGSVANNSGGALKAGRPTGGAGATFPNQAGKHNISEHSGLRCIYCHPFTSGDIRHGWSNGAKSSAAQVGGAGTLMPSWTAATKSCTALCHADTAEIRTW